MDDKTPTILQLLVRSQEFETVCTKYFLNLITDPTVLIKELFIFLNKFVIKEKVINTYIFNFFEWKTTYKKKEREEKVDQLTPSYERPPWLLLLSPCRRFTS